MFRRCSMAPVVLCLVLSAVGRNACGGVAYTLTLLGQLPDVPNSMAYGINDNGQVAGYSEDFDTGTPHAFLWQPGSGLENLNPLIGEEHQFCQRHQRQRAGRRLCGIQQ